MLLFSKGTLNSLKFCLSCSENQFPTSSVMLLKTQKNVLFELDGTFRNIHAVSLESWCHT